MTLDALQLRDALAALQLRDALQALDTAHNTFLTAVRTLERSGIDPGIVAGTQLRAESARFCTNTASDYARLALLYLEGGTSTARQP